MVFHFGLRYAMKCDALYMMHCGVEVKRYVEIAPFVVVAGTSSETSVQISYVYRHRFCKTDRQRIKRPLELPTHIIMDRKHDIVTTVNPNPQPVLARWMLDVENEVVRR